MQDMQLSSLPGDVDAGYVMSVGGLLCCIDNRDYEMRCVECVAGMLPDDDKSGAYGAGKLTKRL